MAQAVTIKSVTKTFNARSGELPVLADLALQAKPGEILALLGPSGCGKSTVLRLLGGLETPTTGVVMIGDRAVTSTDPRCAVVFQEPRLLPWRDVSANVALGANRRKDKIEEPSKALIARLLERVHLSEFAKSLPHQLSGGMAQRVALARGLAAEPEVLLLDEPFAALDALTRMRMQDLLIEVWADRKPTVVLVTHDIDEALVLADRIVILGGTRPSNIVAELSVAAARPRDRNDAEIIGLRAQILGHFGLSHETARPHHELASADCQSPIAAD